MPLCFSMFFVGCRDTGRYYGNYPEAYTVAINSLIGAYGTESTVCGFIEEDDYGRAMYFYWKDTDGVITDDLATTDEQLARCAVLICQKTENGVVSFYPDYSFISFPAEYEKGDFATEEYIDKMHQIVIQSISNDDLDRLMSLNDWGRPLDDSKCISLEVVYKSKEFTEREKPFGIFAGDGLVKESQIKEFYSSIHPKTVNRLEYVYLTSDNYERHIYFIRGIDAEYNYTEPYVIMFNPDGSYDAATGYMEMTDLYNYQDSLRLFKEQNQWNKPL